MNTETRRLIMHNDALIADLTNAEIRLRTALLLLQEATGKSWKQEDLDEHVELIAAPATPDELAVKIMSAKNGDWKAEWNKTLAGRTAMEAAHDSKINAR